MNQDKMSSVEEFRAFREEMNSRILDTGNIDTKRFFGLDSKVFDAGKLPAQTKEMMGLVASMVLRCDDCITYHVTKCCEAGVDRESFTEIFNIALVVGGSIVIPHMRRAVALLDELEVS